MRLAVTRDAKHLAELANEASARSIDLLPLPLTTDEAVPFEWPFSDTSDKPDWITFSSANGVHHFFDQLENRGIQLVSTTRIAAVGGKTARVIEDLGRDVAFVPSRNYGESLFVELVAGPLKPMSSVVYARAETSQYDPKPLLESRRIQYYPIVCYRTVPREIDKDAVSPLTTDDRILFTAPSKVIAYNDRFGSPAALPIAIGQTTALTMKRLGWERWNVMKVADIRRIWEYI